MPKGKITIVHAVNLDMEIHKEPSVYAPKDMVYIVPDNTTVLQMARTIHQAEMEVSEWIRRYENVLEGLKYWREKALDK